MLPLRFKTPLVEMSGSLRVKSSERLSQLDSCLGACSFAAVKLVTRFCRPPRPFFSSARVRRAVWVRRAVRLRAVLSLF